MNPMRCWVVLLVLLASVEPVAAKDVSTLSPFVKIQTPAADDSGEPWLYATPAGKVYLSWIEPARAGHRMRFATLEDDGWTEPRTIAEGKEWFVNWADVPSMVATDEGHLAAHWLEKNGPDTYAYGVRISQSLDGGTTWSAPVVPHDDSQTEHGFVSLLPYRDGVLAAWLDGRKFAGEDATKEMTVRSAHIGRDGTVSGAVEIDGRACDCCPTGVAASGDGAVLVYRDRSADEIRDIRVTHYSKTGWASPRSVRDDGWKIAGCPVNGPAVDASSGEIWVAWFTMTGETPTVLARHLPDGGPVHIDQGNPIGRVDVVALGESPGSGGALVSWVETVGEGAEIRVRHVGSEPGPVHTIATTTAARGSGFPRIVVSGDRVIAAWTQPGDPSRVKTAWVELTTVTDK